MNINTWQKCYKDILYGAGEADQSHKNQIVLKNFPIKPYNININSHFFNAFGNSETEVSANWLVNLAQRNDSWRPFSYEEINTLYHVKYPHEPFYFNNLIKPGRGYSIVNGYYSMGGGWIREEENGLLYFTSDFIVRCYLCSPQNFSPKLEKIFKTEWNKLY